MSTVGHQIAKKYLFDLAGLWCDAVEKENTEDLRRIHAEMYDAFLGFKARIDQKNQRVRLRPVPITKKQWQTYNRLVEEYGTSPHTFSNGKVLADSGGELDLEKCVYIWTHWAWFFDFFENVLIGFDSEDDEEVRPLLGDRKQLEKPKEHDGGGGGGKKRKKSRGGHRRFKPL